VELHVAAELERVALAVARDLPGLGQAGQHLAVLRVDHGEGIGELDEDLPRGRTVGDVRVQGVDVLARGEHQLAARLGLRGRRQRRQQD
jgi:hypothetical protein